MPPVVIHVYKYNIWGLSSLIKCGAFNEFSDLSACCAHERETDTGSLCPVLVALIIVSDHVHLRSCHFSLHEVHHGKIRAPGWCWQWHAAVTTLTVPPCIYSRSSIVLENSNSSNTEQTPLSIMHTCVLWKVQEMCAVKDSFLPHFPSPWRNNDNN